MEPPRYWGTEKGLIVELISQGVCEFWNELAHETGFPREKLNVLLKELYESKELYKNDEGEIRVAKQLYKEYTDYLKDNKKVVRSITGGETPLREKIKNWIDLQSVEASLDKDHFFLEGRYLDQFTKFLMDKARSQILVVNPFVDECDLSQQLCESGARGLKVSCFTRKPDSESMLRCHGKMKNTGVDLEYDQDVHAKLVVVDNQVAIVSSMNFFGASSAGKTWEAGMVTIDTHVIEAITKAVLKEIKM